MRVCGGCVVKVCVLSCSELLLFLLCRHYVVKGPEETPYFGETEAKLAS